MWESVGSGTQKLLVRNQCSWRETVLAEPPIYVTRMARCKVCGTTFPSANQTMSGEALESWFMKSSVEMCPDGHVNDYVSLDYYFV